MRLADGFEDAFVGTTISAFGRKQVAIYDYDKCILILMHDNHMTEDDAIEYFDYNVMGSWDRRRDSYIHQSSQYFKYRRLFGGSR